MGAFTRCGKRVLDLRNMNSIVTCLVFFFCTAHAMNDESRLMTSLLRDYDPRVRPVDRASQTVNVTLMFFIVRIMDVNEKAGIITTFGWLHQEWYDVKLKWLPEDFGGIRSIIVPASNLWTPKARLINNADAKFNIGNDEFALVSSDGRVKYQPQLTIRSYCPIDLRFFPLDTQRCTIRFGSWFYDTQAVNYTNIQLSTTDPEHLAKMSANSPGWKITELSVKQNIIEYGIKYYAEMIIGVTMDRVSVYHRYLFTVPSVLLSLLTAFIFLIPPESGERITLGVGIILGTTVLLSMLENYLPLELSYFPLVGVHTVLVLSLCVLALLLSIIILNFFHRDVRTDKLPHYIKVVLLDYAARFMLLKRHPYFQVDEEKLGTDTTDGARGDANLQPQETTDDTRRLFKVMKSQPVEGSRVHRLIITEWHQAALVLDRILFILYLLIIVISTIVVISSYGSFQ